MGDVVAYRVLGPVEVVRDDSVVPLGRGTLTDLLAILIMSANQIVPTETIIETVWHARPPTHPQAALHSAVARLRRLIGGESIETLAAGYRLRADADMVDFLRFERLRSAASQLPAPQDALSALTEAVELWHGTPLENVASPALLTEAAPRLTQLYLSACEDWAALCLETGQHDAVVSRLAGLVDANPFRERMIGQLMLALYRGGRQADAIAAYQALRRALSDEMGIDPGPPLQELHVKILRAEPSLRGRPDQASGAQPAVPAQSRDEPAELSLAPAVIPRQLPRDLPDFCGREEEIARMTELPTGRDPMPGGTPVTVISGKGGIGKTALAIQAAHRLAAAFPDGQLLANLHGGGPQPALATNVLASFLRALGVTGPAVPGSLEDRVAMFRSLTADRQMLIVLDNAASESQVQPLLPASASCAVIITSRARLTGLSGARLIHLDVLDDDHAMDLLGTIIGCERVTAEQADARLLVSLCGGLPLALRIVGMRLAAKAHWPLATLTGRLLDKRRRLNELAYGDLDMRATFAVSFEALDDPAKAMLRRLSLLDAPDVPAWAGAALLDISPDEAADICERLVDAQLLDPVAHRPRGDIRYQFHDLVRAFARDLACASEPEEALAAAADRAFGAWLALAGLAHRHVYGGDYTVLHGSAVRWTGADAAQQEAIRRDPVSWLEGERLAILAVIRQSAEAGRPAVSWDLAWTAVTLWEARAYYDDWAMATEHALSAARSAGDTRGTAAMLTCLASMQVQAGQSSEQTLRLVEEALRLFSHVADVHGCAIARYRLGVVQARVGNLDAAISEYERSRHDAHEAGDAFVEAGVLRELGSAHLQRGELEVAAACLTEALRLHEGVGSLRGKALTLHTLGELRLRQGDPQAARTVFQQVLDMIQPVNDIVGQAHATLGLAEALVSAGLRGQAQERLLMALQLGRQIRNRTIENRAQLALDQLTRPATRSEYSQQAAGIPG